MIDPALVSLANEVLQKARGLRLKIVTAESCTGGLLSAALTANAGSSDVFERGYVVYSNEAKEEALGVDPAVITARGAVSKTVAVEMAAGALKHSRAHLSVAVTGVAGPSGGSPEKPVGLVHFAAAKLERRDGDRVEFAAIHVEERFGDIGRAEVRAKAVEAALRLLLEAAALR